MDIIKYNEILKRDFSGAKAKIWLFNKTHSRIVIRLWLFDQAENKVLKEIFISALGCNYILGPFHWENSHICIEQHMSELNNELNYKIVDKSAGFELFADGGIGLLDQENQIVNSDNG